MIPGGLEMVLKRVKSKKYKNKNITSHASSFYAAVLCYGCPLGPPSRRSTNYSVL